jgi:transcriptional regulator with XRE-family HTH domain
MLQQDIDVDSINPAHYLQQKFGWTLQRIAEEMDYSDSIVRQWSCGYRNPSRRAKKDAYRVYQEHATK